MGASNYPSLVWPATSTPAKLLSCGLRQRGHGLGAPPLLERI